LLSLAALEMPLQWWSKVEGRDTSKDAVLFLANDWHAAMVAVYLACKFRKHFVLENCRSMLAIHNLMHQGAQDPVLYPMLGLGEDDYSLFDFPENNLVFNAPLVQTGGPTGQGSHNGVDNYWGHWDYDSLDVLNAEEGSKSGERCINMLVAGIRTADRIVTVSSTYAWEICEKNSFGFGFGLQSELLKRRDDIHGVTNGIDLGEWDPATDEHIRPNNFSLGDLAGKRACKRALAEDLGLSPDISVPLVGFIGRLDRQKGADVLLDALPSILESHTHEKVHVVMLGTGDAALESRIQAAQASFPDCVRGISEFNVALSHRIVAASDILVMPSRFEPCGLNQMFAKRYGTVPVVHSTGGLSDTVQDFNQLTCTGTGWTFKPCSPEALLQSVTLALTVLAKGSEEEGFGRNNKWQQLVKNCMESEHGWPNAAAQYEMLMQWTQMTQTHHKSNKVVTRYQSSYSN